MKKKPKRTYLDVIWHLVRSSRHFDTDEIERMSGAARATVLEYLGALKHLGYLRKIDPRKWQLVKDPGPATPVNAAKRKKLRDIRRHRRDAKSAEV